MIIRIKKYLAYLYEIADTICNNRAIKEDRNVDDSNRIVFNRVDGIGDFVIWLDTLEEYKKIYKGKRFVIICDKPVAELARGMDCFDEIVTIDYKKLLSLNIKYYRHLKKKLKAYTCEVLISPMTMRGIAKDYVSALVPAKKKITPTGWRLKSITKFIEKRVYDEIIEIQEEDITEIEKNAEFVRKLGAKEFKSGYTIIQDFSSKIEIEGGYYVMQVGASTLDKCLESNKLREVVLKTCEITDLKCCLVGKDVRLSKMISGGSKRIINFCGKTSLSDMAHIIHNSKFFIGNDTSGVHLAMMMRIPTVAITGGWHYGKFLPYKSDNNSLNNNLHVVVHKTYCYKCNNQYTKECVDCIKNNGCYKCIHEIACSDVMAAINKTIEEIDNCEKVGEKG